MYDVLFQWNLLTAMVEDSVASKLLSKMMLDASKHKNSTPLNICVRVKYTH